MVGKKECIYGSVYPGIEVAHLVLQPLALTPIWFSEIESS